VLSDKRLSNIKKKENKSERLKVNNDLI
jgi:hypothetical protein